MSEIPPSTMPEPPRISIAGFLALSSVSGLTIGMANIVTQLYAIDLGLDTFQIGFVMAMELVGMMLLTVPAGFIIARHGARIVYFLASFGPLAANFAIPFLTGWGAIAMARTAMGVCIPFRTVSMNSAFLAQLKRIGVGKAGWYRGSLTLGMAILGPAAATLAVHRIGFFWAFMVIAALFGAMALFSLSFFPQRAPGTASAAHGGVRAEIAGLLRNADIAESCGIEFVSSATASLFSTFIILTALAIPGLSAQDGVNVLLVEGVVVLAALFLGADVLKRLGRRQAYAIGLALTLAALVSIGLASGFVALAVGGVLLAAGGALVHLVNMILLSRLDGDKSKASGVYQLAQMLGGTLGALGGGLMGKFMPVQSVFLLWIPLLLLAILPIWLFGRQSALLGEARA